MYNINKPQAYGTKAKSVFKDLPWFKTDDAQVNMNRAVQAAGHIDDKRTAGARYREAVLSHPDLTARLKLTWDYTNPEQWNGYVPAADHDGRPSSSPHRALLVQLVTEALNRNDDWQHGDAERLAVVPERYIRSPWKEDQYGPSPAEQAARIEQILNEDRDNN